MNDRVTTADLYDCDVPYLQTLFSETPYPWLLLTKIKSHVAALLQSGIEGFERFGDDVLVGEGVVIAPTAVIDGPAVLGAGTVLRPGAYLRGNVITGRGCVIGNSCEVKHAILLDAVQIPHYNYVGDSVLGNRAHMGAGAVCSNLKSDKTSVVIHAQSDYVTGLKKVGGFLADDADVGCGCVVNPGTVIGKRTSVYPLTSLRGVYPGDHIVKTAQNAVVRKNR